VAAEVTIKIEGQNLFISQLTGRPAETLRAAWRRDIEKK